MDPHLEAVARVYGPETWDVYRLLDRTADPRGPEAMVSLAAEYLKASSYVLDVGCRDASHLIELVQRSGASGVGIEPVSRLAEQAREAVAAADLTSSIEIVQGEMRHIPYPDASFDLVWCRDVIELVGDLAAGVAEVARVLRPDGRLVVFTVFATDLLEPQEAAMLLGQNLAAVPGNMVRGNVEAAFSAAGLVVELVDEIGTEWREYAEERTRPVSRDLLRLARLRRQRGLIVGQAGEAIYGHIESNLHWSVYQFLGKLLPTVYVLSKPG